MFRHIFTVVLSFGVFLFSGCGSDTESETQALTLGCIASVTSSDTVNRQITVLVSGTGGTSPYQVVSGELSDISVAPSNTSTFTSSLSTSFNFSALTSISNLTGSVTVQDSVGSTSFCSLSTGSSTTTGSLSCSITPSNTAPALNEAVTYTVVGSGGTSPYVFSSFSSGGVNSSSISSASSTTGTATAYYTTSGTKTVSALVTDSLGESATCSTTVSVGTTSGGTKSSGLWCEAVSYSPVLYAGQSTTIKITAYSYEPTNFNIYRVTAPSGSGIQGQFTSSTTMNLYFPYRGTFPIIFYMSDTYGRQAQCTATQAVY